MPDAIGTNSIDLPPGWVSSSLAPKYEGGIVRWDGAGGDVMRTILRVEGETRLILSGQTTDLSGGEGVRVSFGCNRTMEIVDGHPVSDCHDLHDNVKNFGGCFLIPTVNPIGTRANMYY